MIAAIYARKSAEQHSADADAKSVSRQIENARAFATAKGWSVAEPHVYADDAVSGAEVRRLENRQRMLDIIRAGAPFQVLLMRDDSRFSRRDGDEVLAELRGDRARRRPGVVLQGRHPLHLRDPGGQRGGLRPRRDECRVPATDRHLDT
jgi:DNA invertase Pin-like site-specific DNA recombinase